MPMRLTNAQLMSLADETSRIGLDGAARELFAQTRQERPIEQIRTALDKVRQTMQPIGIERIKYLKILALRQLYPEAAPEPALAGQILRGPGDQDARMRRLLELPPRRKGTTP